MTLRTWQHGETCCISVADTGEGMSPDAQAHLFEPFFTTKYSGHLGLGLAICRGLVEAHGGSVRVESVPGSGTVVTLAFPRANSVRWT